MAYHLDDTIVAIASPPGGAARGIVRLSGPEVVKITSAVFTFPDFVDLKRPHRAIAGAGSLRLERIERGLPAILYLWPNSRSYTRQPSAEIHTLGSPPLLASVLDQFCRAGARLAEPGEFTLRAVLAGRIDLTQAEAVLGVIDARTNQDLQMALDQLAGGLAAPLAAARECLLDLLANLEAGLDFVDQDIQFINPAEIAAQVAQAQSTIARVSEQLGSRHDATSPMRIVLAGEPNVGKSSLFNALTGGRALVSALPGTTRDYLTARIDLNGIPCELVDTAGKDYLSALEEVNRRAQAQSTSLAAHAEIVLLCIDSSRPPTSSELAELETTSDPRRIVVLTKCDVMSHPTLATIMKGLGVAITSATTGQGIDLLSNRLHAIVADTPGGNMHFVAATAIRLRDNLRVADQSLMRALQLNAEQGGEELVAAEVRVAVDELGKAIGKTASEDLLDRIFSRFCIGK